MKDVMHLTNMQIGLMGDPLRPRLNEREKLLALQQRVL